MSKKGNGMSAAALNKDVASKVWADFTDPEYDDHAYFVAPKDKNFEHPPGPLTRVMKALIALASRRQITRCTQKPS